VIASYQPFYCEENIWQLVCDSRFADRDRQALFIGNERAQVALWEQRLAAEGEPIIWDYHVVACIEGAVWDLDTRLPLPSSLALYLARTFRPVPAALAPRFRLVPFAELSRTFATDRRHMRRADGSWREPPPSWPPPCAPGFVHTLDRYLDFDDAIAGRVRSRAELQRAFAVG
jgi:hypothetical protein